MPTDKEWSGLEKSWQGGHLFRNIRKDHHTVTKLTVKEKSGVLDVEVKGEPADLLSARIEGEYLCIRKDRPGIAKVIPGHVIKKVYLHNGARSGKVITKKAGNTLCCRLIKKS